MLEEPNFNPLQPYSVHLGESLRTLLANDEIKLVVDCPKGQYRLEYFTTRTKDRASGELMLNRKYRLVDLIRGNTTVEPWDKYDHHTQASILTGLINWSSYRVTKVIDGWAVDCPTCGHRMNGKIWEDHPATCTGKARPACHTKIDASLVKDMPYAWMRHPE